MAAEINLEGMEELLTKIEALGKKASSAENDALKAGAKPIQEMASSLAPRSSSVRQARGGTNSWRTGEHLADNIEISSVKTKYGVKYVLIGIDKGDMSKYFYGKFLEWGRSGMDARPFLQPAFEMKRTEAKEIIKQKLREALGL